MNLFRANNRAKVNRVRAAGWIGGALCLAGIIVPATACEENIVWKADLSGTSKTLAGTAAIEFDFVHPGATVQVDATGLQDVRSIELHVARSYSDHGGPTVLTLYSATAGQMPPHLTKRVTEADLQKQTDPKISTFTDLVQAVLNGRAFVMVATKAHPQGELSGFITMRKEAIYSDNPSDLSHDPALHQAAQKSP